MQAVILAGGLGTRLWPLTISTPKPLLPVMGRPLLAHLLARLPAGVKEVFLAVSFRAARIQQWADEADDPALVHRRVRVVKEDPPLGTGGALAHLVDQAGLGEDGDPVLVLNGDLVADLDLKGLVDAHGQASPSATIMLVAVQDPSRYGIMDMDGDWRIRRFIEKPRREEAPSEWANAGAYVLDRDALAGIPRGRPVSLEREVFPGLAAGEGGMRGRAHRGLWVDCGTRESYLEAHRALLEKRDASASPRDCFYAAGVDVAVDARVRRSVLHADVVVKAGARVVESVLGAGCVVGEGAVVERSLVAAGATLRDGAKVSGARVVPESG